MNFHINFWLENFWKYSTSKRMNFFVTSIELTFKTKVCCLRGLNWLVFLMNLRHVSLERGSFASKTLNHNEHLNSLFSLSLDIFFSLLSLLGFSLHELSKHVLWLNFLHEPLKDVYWTQPYGQTLKGKKDIKMVGFSHELAYFFNSMIS